MTKQKALLQLIMYQRLGQHLMRKSILHTKVQVPHHATIALYVQVITILPLVARWEQKAIIRETEHAHIHRET